MRELFILFTAILFFSNNIMAEPSKKLELKDLGFSAEETKGSEEKTQVMEERAYKLKTHQVLGIITWAAMALTMLSAPDHKKTSDVHKILGLSTTALYFTTAYFSLSAPPLVQDSNKGLNIKLHKILAWIHFPLMILTPVTGFIAENQIKKGQKVHGFGSAMGPLGTATFLTFTAAAAVMVFEF